MDQLLQMSVELAKAHLSASPIEAAKIPALIQDIYRTLKDLSDRAGALDNPVPTPRSPASSSAAPGEVAAVINSDTSGPDFEGLDPWLAARLPRRIARRLNRAPSIHPSVFEEYLICLEDGERVKLLRPYIKNRFGLTISEYVDRWNLPDAYPVAPPSFVAAKREKAKASGLGVTLRGARGPSKQRLGSKAKSARKRSVEA